MAGPVGLGLAVRDFEAGEQGRIAVNPDKDQIIECLRNEVRRLRHLVAMHEQVAEQIRHENTDGTKDTEKTDGE